MPAQSMEQCSLSASNPVVVKVSYTDNQGKQQTGQGSFAGGRPPQVGDSVSTYYSTSDPSQVVVVNLPGLGELNAIADTLRTAAVVCLIVGSVLLLASILGLALGRKQPASVAGAAYPPGPPQQPPAGYPASPIPSPAGSAVSARALSASATARSAVSTAAVPASAAARPAVPAAAVPA